MLLKNQINSFANFAFNLLILFVDLYCIILFIFYFFDLFIFFIFFFSKHKSVVFSCFLKKYK